MDETRKCWIERQSPGTWIAAIADSLPHRSSPQARQEFSKTLCDFLLQHLFMGSASTPPNSLLLSFLTQTLASKVIEPHYFFSLPNISDPAKPRVFKVYIQQLYLFFSHIASPGDKSTTAPLPSLLLRICTMLLVCVSLQFEKETSGQQNGLHISSHPTTTEDYCRLWNSALSQTEQQRDVDIKKENASMAAQLLTMLLTSSPSLSMILIGKETSAEWPAFESGMKKLHAIVQANRKPAAALSSSAGLSPQASQPLPSYLYVLLSCFGNVMWPLTLQSTFRTSLQRNLGWGAVLLLADELEAEHPQQPALEYALQWETLASDLSRAAAWRFGQLARLAARPWRIFSCRLIAAALAAVTGAPLTPPIAALRARLFLLARLPQLFLAWNKDPAYDSLTKPTFLELSGDTSDACNTLELALAHLSAFPSMYLHAGSNLLDEVIQSFAAHALVSTDRMRSLLGRETALAAPPQPHLPLDERVTTVDAARVLLNALLSQKDWARQERIASALVASLSQLAAPHPLIEAVLRDRETVCAILCVQNQIPALIVQLFRVCHRSAESATVLADALALLLHIFVKYDFRTSVTNQAAVHAALEQDQQPPAAPQITAEAAEAAKPESKRRKTAGGRSKVEEAPAPSAATHTPLPADAPVLKWYRSWLANTAAIGAAVEGDPQQAAEVLLAELLSPVRGAPARRDGWRTLAACECVTERVLQGLVAGRLDWNSALQALTALVSDHPHVIPAVGKWLADHQHTFPAAQNSPHPEISATAAVGLELFGPQAASASAMLDVVRELHLLDFNVPQSQQGHTIPLAREPLSTTIRSTVLGMLHRGLRTDSLQKLRRAVQRSSADYFAQVMLQELVQLVGNDSAASTGSAALVHVAQLAACTLATIGGADAVQYALTAGLALATVGLSTRASSQQLAHFYATLVSTAANTLLPETQRLLQPLWRALAAILDSALSNPSASLGFAVTLIALLQRLPACSREAPLLQLAQQLTKLGLEEMVLPLFDLTHPPSRSLCNQFYVLLNS